MKRILISLFAMTAFSTTQANDIPAAVALNPYPAQMEALREVNNLNQHDLDETKVPNEYYDLSCKILNNNIDQLILSARNLDKDEAEQDFQQAKQNIKDALARNKKINLTCDVS